MRNDLRKYFIDNVGPFAKLDESDLNELVAYEIQLIQVPAILYVKSGYHYTGDELTLSFKELETLIISTLNNSLN